MEGLIHGGAYFRNFTVSEILFQVIATKCFTEFLP